MMQNSGDTDVIDISEGSQANWDKIGAYFSHLAGFYRLYFVIAVVFFVFAIVSYITATPVYTAVAIVGPPNPSPMTSLLSSLTGSSGAAGVTRRLLGGQGSSANDPFQEYLQLLSSTRLAHEVAEQDGVMPVVFEASWDAETHSWRPPGALNAIIGVVKTALHRPVKDHPDLDDFSTYLSRNFRIAESNVRKSTLLSSASGYMLASFSFTDRHQAEVILDKILHRADTIIREEQLRDVLARISYLRNELPSITQTEQREALIATLTGQEELKMMIMADHRYASTLVDQPYASPKPTSPGSPVGVAIEVLLLAGLVWIALIQVAPRNRTIGKFVYKFGPRQ